MLIRRQTTNLLQIFCEISFHSQVIFKSMKVADNISRGTLECKWVKVFKGLIPQTTEIVDIYYVFKDAI